MLAGENTDMLTVVYGPAPRSTWPLLAESPKELMNRNGLWEAILNISDALLVDSATAPHNPIPAYTREHWASAMDKLSTNSLCVNPIPLQVGEQDIDTIIHLLFTYHSRSTVFECLCNPPGGDWSGMSLKTADCSLELRWLGLPRVTAAGSKRPDHVFQIFKLQNKPIIIAIESKESGRDVENSIGPSLIKYVSDLISSPPSVERQSATTPWSHSAHPGMNNSSSFISIAAFVAQNDEEVNQVAIRADADLVIGFSFSKDHKSCLLKGMVCTDSGKTLWEFISGLDLHMINIDLHLV